MKLLLCSFLLLVAQAGFALNSTNTAWASANLLNAANAAAARSNLGALRVINIDTTDAAAYAAMANHNVDVVLQSPLVVSGSFFSDINQTYYISSTNLVGSDVQAIWTNAVNEKIIYMRDQGASVNFLTVVIESEPNDSAWYYGGGANAAYPYVPSNTGWGANDDIWPELSADTIVITYETAATPYGAAVVTFTNSFLVPYFSTNLIVNKQYGSDTNAFRGNGINFLSLNYAASNALSGDIIDMVSDNYTNAYYSALGSGIRLPQGVTVLGNKSKQAGAFFITDNNTVSDLEFLTQPNISITNTSTSKTILNNIRVTGSTDYMIVDTAAGFLQQNNPQQTGFWDGWIYNTVVSNSFIQVNNPSIKLEQDGLTGVTWGMHGIGWKVASTNGGRMQINGGTISVLNSTNSTFSGTELQGNACIYIGQKAGTTGNGNASLELYGTVLVHGSTNAGASTHAISNAVNVPTHGMYFDVIAGADSTKPIVSAQMHSFDGIRMPVIVVTKTASYTVTTNEFNKRFNNSGASGAITFSLPAAVVGATYVFKVVTAQSLVIDAAASDTIQYSTSVTAASGAINSATVGSSITLTCEAANKWFAEAMVGTWAP